MKRPETRAPLAAVSFCGVQLALFLALVPLAPTDARADSASLGKKLEMAPVDSEVLEALKATAEPVAEPPEDPAAFDAEEVRDDILVLLAELPTPEPKANAAQAAVVTPEDPEQPANPKAEMVEEEPELVDLVLPSKTMGGY